MRRSALAYAALDLLGCLLLVVWTLVAPPTKAQSIETLGKYAIVIAWPDKSCDDVDLYTQDPDGNIVFYLNVDAGLMHLEHDDIGCANDAQENVTIARNYERVVLRGTIPGEYVVNVHLYNKKNPDPTPVIIQLYRLKGEDALLLSKGTVLSQEGEEHTAFRFRLDAKENLIGTSQLPKDLVG